jgi:hypothetical protein
VTSAQGEDDATRHARESKDEAILVLLGKLSLHYWRPDFTPAQAKQLYRDYVEDLRPYPFEEIDRAISKYRANGANRFYPTSGQIIDHILGKAELEAANPGAPDRARTLSRIAASSRAEAHTEVRKMATLIGQATA